MCCLTLPTKDRGKKRVSDGKEAFCKQIKLCTVEEEFVDFEPQKLNMFSTSVGLSKMVFVFKEDSGTSS